jgi:acyl dehydratase
MLLLSYAVGLAGFDPEHVLALRAIDDVTFRRPVRIGDTIRLQAEVEECREIDAAAGLVTLRWRVLNQEDEVAVRARVKALWNREGEAASEAEDAQGSDSDPAPREVYL